MKKLIVIISISVLLFIGVGSIKAVSEKEMKETIEKVAVDFEKENGKQSCSIGGIKYSLGAILYSFTIQEGGRKDDTIGDKTNNRGSLHKSQGVKDVVKTIYADSTNTRPVYKTAYDGVYEKAILLTKSGIYNKCNLSFTSIKCYVKGCKAKLDSQGQKYIQALYSNLRKNATKRDNRGYIPQQDKKQDKKIYNVNENLIEDDNKICRKIKTIQKGNWIQVDYGDESRYLNVSDMKGERLWLYSCYKK